MKQQAVIKVDGMSCNHCKQAVEAAVKKITGVVVAGLILLGPQVLAQFNTVAGAL